MFTEIGLFFLSFILTFLLYPVWIWFVYRFQMGEQIRLDGPTSHLLKRGTPTMGGVVFILVVAVITFSLNQSRTQTLLPVLVALSAGLFGIIEDFGKIYKKSGLPGFLTFHFSFFFNGFKNRIQNISQPSTPIYASFTKIVLAPYNLFKEFWRVVGSKADVGLQTHHKFLIQGAIGAFVSYWTYFKLGWDYIWFPLLGDIHIGIFYPIFIFFLFIIVLNSVAFTDGLDGLAGGLSFIALCACWVLASKFGYNSLAAYLATFLGALLPFLYFNVYPARIFMGNVGSHVLGATLALLGVLMHREIALLFILMVFLVDGISSPLQQLSAKLTKKRLFRMAPIHHHFEMLGWPETKVTLRFWLFGIFFAFVGILVAIL